MQHLPNQQLSDVMSHPDEDLARIADASSLVAPPRDPIDETQTVLKEQVSLSIQMRRTRRTHFGTDRLSGPPWDMMLDLMLAQLNRRALSASDLATGAGVPLSSGLRMIAALEKLNLVQRSIDQRDRRRTIVGLTDMGHTAMTSYFAQFGQAWESRQRWTA